jgi:hypothetical protein
MCRLSTLAVAFPVSIASLMGCTNASPDLDDTPTAEVEQAVVDCSVAWEKELMITDTLVVRDNRAKNMGPWSFGGLIQAIKGNTNAQEFVKRFLESWMTDQVIDGVTVKARPKIKELVIDPWKAKSGNGTYDLAKAPFDLLAIVYRVDLRKQGRLGSGGGEGRFVFGVRNAQGKMTPFTVIFEFKLPRVGGRTSEVWANDWHALGQYMLGSPAYNQKLEVITNRFASAASKANKNLNQLRTNEIALDLGLGHPPIWELREFHIHNDGYLHPAHPALTPLGSVNGTSTLTNYVLQNQQLIEEGKHSIPVQFQGSLFTSSAAEAPTNSFFWNVPGVSATLQHKFSVQTCNGCHAGDTVTNFLHVGPDFVNGGAATLSDFIVNTEMPRRTVEIKKLLGCVQSPPPPSPVPLPVPTGDDDDDDDDLR